MSFRNQHMQYTASILVSILSLLSGYNISWTSPILEKLQSDDSPIGVKLTLAEGAWVAPTLLLGILTGNILVGPLQDIIGRRKILLYNTVPTFICWMMILFANSYAMLIATRFLLGICTVVPTVVNIFVYNHVTRKNSAFNGFRTTAMYISEISEPSVRGKLGMFNLMNQEVGMLLVTVLGSYWSYASAAIGGAIIPVVFLISFYWMPESPYFYLRKGDLENAAICLKRIRMDHYKEKELLDMHESVKMEMKEKSSFSELFRIAKYRKAVIVILGAKTLQQFSGTVGINSYTKTIFNQVESALDSKASSVISTFIGIPAVLLGSYVIDKMGRKPLYCISTIGCGIALICEFVYFFLKDYMNEDVAYLGLLPFSGIFIFNIFRALGIQTIPVILISEIFPTNVKAWGLVVTLLWSALLAFLVTLGFPLVVDAWGMHFCFLFFFIFCVLGLLFIIFVIPETKGETLHGIQEKIECEVNNL